MVSVAGAYSELDNFVAMISVAENNLRGRAERVSLDAELGGRTSYDFKFYEPYLDSRDTALDVSVFDTQRQRRFVGGAAVSLAEDQFEERRTGTTVTLSRPMTDTERASIGLRSEQVSSSFLQGTRNLGYPLGPMAIPGPEPPPPGDTNDPLIVAAPLHPGGRVNSLSLGWQRDSRDIVANPTRGSYQSISLELAGSLLGGESTYQRYSLDRRRYFAVRGHKDVIALRLMLGTTTGNIPLFDSFTVGGARSLRGYEQDRFRGESVALFNAEYRYGLSKSLTLVVGCSAPRCLALTLVLTTRILMFTSAWASASAPSPLWGRSAWTSASAKTAAKLISALDILSEYCRRAPVCAFLLPRSQ